MEHNEHERLIALFALSLLNHLPPELALRIWNQLDELGQMAAHDGDTTVGIAARELASLLNSATKSRM